jgi:hypothetical protein
MRVVALQYDFDVPVVGRELNGIREKIRQDLLQTPCITLDEKRFGIKPGAKPNVLRLSRWTHGIHNALNYRSKLDRMDIKPQLACGDARDI